MCAQQLAKLYVGERDDSFEEKNVGNTETVTVVRAEKCWRHKVCITQNDAVPPGHIWNIDFNGKVRTPSLQYGFRYYLVSVDTFSRFVFTAFLRTKNEAAGAWRSDKGTRYTPKLAASSLVRKKAVKTKHGNTSTDTKQYR